MKRDGQSLVCAFLFSSEHKQSYVAVGGGVVVAVAVLMLVADSVGFP